MFNGALSGGSGVNNMLYSLSGILNNAQQSMAQTLNEFNSKNGGMLDPIQMTQLQMYTQNYLAFIQLVTSMVKQFGDLDKTVATNIGS
jgi:hypothetical protein